METKTKKRINIKSVYEKSDLERHDFFESPSTSCQNILGLRLRHFFNDNLYEKDLNFFMKDKSRMYNIDNYKFVKKLNDGSEGVLYTGKEIHGKQKDIVIKRIRKNNNDWRTELNVLLKIKKENILRNNVEQSRLLNIIDYYDSPWCVYIITEYYKGLDLFEHIIINIPYSYSNAKKLTKDMLLCIKECHDMGIAHLDIKFENFIYKKIDEKNFSQEKNDNFSQDNFSENKRLILIDFGHSIPIEKGRVESIGSYGTIYYICPEGFRGYYSLKSDIWSLGMCIHLLLTEDFPFEGDDDDSEFERNVVKGNIYIDDNLSDDAYDFISRCLDYDISSRATVDELLNHPFITNE